MNGPDKPNILSRSDKRFGYASLRNSIHKPSMSITNLNETINHYFYKLPYQYN